MAIATDAFTAGQGFQASSSYTYSHTCTGSNRLLIVNTGGGESDTQTITGVTYAAVAMTLVGSARAPGNRIFGQWYLANPASGANNIVVSATPSEILTSAGSYTGVAQTGTLDASNTGTAATTTSITVSVTTIADNCWVMLTTHAATSGQSPTGGAGTTMRVNTLSDADLADSNAAITPAGSTSLICNTVSNSNWAGIIGSYAPAAAAVVVKSIMNLPILGVG